MLGALLFSVFSSSHLALQVPEPKKADALVMNARALLDTPYVFGGRLGVGRQKEGIDCQGTLFYALEKTYEGCDWRSYSVMPTTTISRKELGAIHLAPVLTKDLRLDRLAPGDFIFMLGWAENPAEEAIATLKGRKVWVWHTALYSGEGRMIVGDHFAGKVIETDLLSYLKEHEDIYVGIMSTRLAMAQRPNVKRCRKGQHLPTRKYETSVRTVTKVENTP